MNDGWVKLHRKIRDNIFLMNDDNAYLVFTKMLLYVNSNGQWAGGRRQLAKLLNKNDRTLYQVLQRLQDNQVITITSNHRYSVYTICNWEKYQQNGNRANQLITTTTQPRRNHDATTTQHSYKNKNKNKNKPASRAVSQIDSELAAKESAARSRPHDGPGYQNARSVADMIKQRKWKPA